MTMEVKLGSSPAELAQLLAVIASIIYVILGIIFGFTTGLIMFFTSPILLGIIAAVFIAWLLKI